MHNRQSITPRLPHGYSLVELMITTALISVLATIAVSAYNGYISESRYAIIRSTINQMRTPIEDFRLENGGYGTTLDLTDFGAISGRFGLDPNDIDFGPYAFTVSVVSTSNYTVWGSYDGDTWIRCENRANRCCDSNAGNDPAAACD